MIEKNEEQIKERKKRKLKKKVVKMSCVLLLLLALSSSSLGEEEDIITLLNADDFINFVNRANSGDDYYGTTVYLGSDLSLSGETLEPIGKYTDYFNGIFDGKGHTISGLKVNTSS